MRNRNLQEEEKQDTAIEKGKLSEYVTHSLSFPFFYMVALT